MRGSIQIQENKTHGDTTQNGVNNHQPPFASDLSFSRSTTDCSPSLIPRRPVHTEALSSAVEHHHIVWDQLRHEKNDSTGGTTDKYDINHASSSEKLNPGSPFSIHLSSSGLRTSMRLTCNMKLRRMKKRAANMGRSLRKNEGESRNSPCLGKKEGMMSRVSYQLCSTLRNSTYMEAEKVTIACSSIVDLSFLFFTLRRSFAMFSSFSTGLTIQRA